MSNVRDVGRDRKAFVSAHSVCGHVPSSVTSFKLIFLDSDEKLYKNMNLAYSHQSFWIYSLYREYMVHFSFGSLRLT